MGWGIIKRMQVVHDACEAGARGCLTQVKCKAKHCALMKNAVRCKKK